MRFRKGRKSTSATKPTPRKLVTKRIGKASRSRCLMPPLSADEVICSALFLHGRRILCNPVLHNTVYQTLVKHMVQSRPRRSSCNWPRRWRWSGARDRLTGSSTRTAQCSAVRCQDLRREVKAPKLVTRPLGSYGSRVHLRPLIGSNIGAILQNRSQRARLCNCLPDKDVKKPNSRTQFVTLQIKVYSLELFYLSYSSGEMIWSDGDFHNISHKNCQKAINEEFDFLWG